MNYTINVIESLKQSFLNDSKLEFRYPKEIKENYLKIISNAFYINLKKCAKEFRKNIDVSTNQSPKELNDLVQTYYRNFLPDSRAEVLKFFKIEREGLIETRTLLRTYSNYMLKSDPMRIKYKELNDQLSIIEKNMSEMIFPEEFINSSHENYHDGPVNRVISLAELITNTVDLRILMS